ncbi:GTP-binding protein TypA/BipA-like protein [Candidatus Xiphinematobacter sp. Idaho Grape]|uniref:translational GTPase TypA n=1 Tax=Candidatus Xiphinematobacter sp. Idaho Grape TaxID=1704307 RepID=UPI000706D134|nr:translational GTPase TypA [Candidatus Xiphinematobacter sp. Idaho Grape]ALJ56545.1 GTP-binding protein TypA/BipA-like protein [Candidatus Xiphinematobacter sp. Idaho Grape]
MEDIRNVAIIAHVDHGKTTLIDQLLLQSGTFRPNQKMDKRVMDFMEIEREKGITICSKNAALRWKNFLINIVDTPGHADFGGEVERVMQTVDGVLLVVDAHDGPQAQTRFVLRKALTHNLKPIVVINKVDRENARPHKVLDMVFELFLELDVTDEQLDFPHVYTSAKIGFAKRELDHSSTDMGPLFEAIVRYIPPPHPSARSYFQFLVASLGHSDYLGRVAYGRVASGKIRVGKPVFRLCRDGRCLQGNVTALFEYKGLERMQIQEALEGHIVGLAGFEDVRIGETITELEDGCALAFVDIDPLTISMRISVNDSPMAGREGKFLTARHIHERLVRETRVNVSLKMLDTGMAGHFEIQARGEMQVAVLAEQMRREGYELILSRPEAVYQKSADNLLEPFETVHVDIPLESLGGILRSFSRRKAEVVKMQHHPNSVCIEAVLPTRGLIGLKTELVSLTRGRGVITHLFKEYSSHKGEIPIQRSGGALISMEAGISTGYALSNIQERGRLFIGPQEDIYIGMIVGEHSRPDDITVNPCKVKHLTNMRSQGEGRGLRLDPPIKMDLERALEFIGPDEYVEVTPRSLRLRKKSLGLSHP